VIAFLAAPLVVWLSVSALLFAKLAGWLDRSGRRHAAKVSDGLALAFVAIGAVVVVARCGAQP
jgi:hypothetical protein